MATPATLSFSDLKEIQNILERHKFKEKKWKELALYLDLAKDVIRSVDTKHASEPNKCLNEILTYWLTSNNHVPTWAMLAEALQEVGYKAACEELLTKVGSPSTASTYSSGDFLQMKQLLAVVVKDLEKTKQEMEELKMKRTSHSTDFDPDSGDIFYDAEESLSEDEDDDTCLTEEAIKLKSYKDFPQKLTMNDALVIQSNTKEFDNGTSKPQLLMNLILEKIMMSNHESRSIFLFKEAIKTDDDDDDYGDDAGDNDDAADDDDDDDDDGNRVSLKKLAIAENPMDTLIALIHCSDNFLRQDIYAKLNYSQLAIPLLLPNPVKKKIIFPLWAMRSIVKYWKCKSHGATYESFEDRVINCEAPLVSFIRFSQLLAQSKSKILNHVISSRNNTFFNLECAGSSVARHFVDGMVEACWYFPSGEKSDLFSNVITFANLRGNASKHENQLRFLIAHSDSFFVFMQEEDLLSSEASIKMFTAIKPNSKVFFIADRMSADGKLKLKDLVPNSIFTTMAKKELAEIVSVIQTKITKKMSDRSKMVLCKLSSCFDSVSPREFNIQVDEHCKPCKRGKALASIIMEYIKQEECTKVKEIMVPLQCPDLWHKWASANKKSKRMKLEETGQGIEKFSSEKREEKEKLRKMQLEKAKSLSYVMIRFVNTLLNELPDVKNYFLRWLKFFMDDHSRIVLPGLQNLCQETRSKLKDKKTTDKAEIKRLRSELQTQAQHLIHASFGLEHLFREIAQIYECANELNQMEAIGYDVAKFPRIAAELLTMGHPLEIVDGDAAHVPKIWIIAVLKELRERLGNCRILVLSVLGIQSTGKSTLINTTFGVQFAVGAGRCTRGAYFQLIKVDCERVDCEYILIIDTEGLRAPELDIQDTQQHDNELATLVIGLASVTIINIFGEVPAEINDILQTTVHAILRMRKVELKPSCVFVKHHVANVTASKTTEGRQKFQEKLDEMTVIAAKAEHCEGQYNNFKDVINFNDETDVFNFPSLWEGNPPMAPVNPAYCEASLKLKSKFIVLCKDDNKVCFLDDFTRRVSLLWEAVLEENFVFSFKNTHEVEAYSFLDAEYGKWSWRLQEIFLEWQTVTRNYVKSQASDLGEIQAKQVQTIEKDLDEEYDKIMVDFIKFFEDPRSSLAPIMIQWRNRYEIKIQNIRDDYKRRAMTFCEELVFSKSANARLQEIKKNHREKFKSHLKNLVSKQNVKTKNVSDAELNGMFRVEWDKLMSEIQEGQPLPVKQNIELNIEKTLRERLQKHEKYLRKELKLHSLSERGLMRPLQLVINTEKHLNIKDWLVFFKKASVEDCRQIAQKETEVFIAQVVSYLSQSHIINYENLHIFKIVDDLIESINSCEKDLPFTFKVEFRIDLILEVSGYALQVFDSKEKENYENHPVVYMATLEDDYRQTFKDLYNQIQWEKSAATSLTNIVIKQLNSSLQDRLSLALVADLRSNNLIFNDKRTLKGTILLRLLKKKDFSLYKVYLKNISESYLYWIRVLIEEHVNQCRNEKKIMEALVENELAKLITMIKTAVENSISTQGVKEWFKSFHSKLSGVLPLNLEQLYELVERDDGELSYLIQEFQKGIDDYKKRYLENSADKSKVTKWSDKNDPALIIRNEIAGCCEQCPFCNEQCEKRHKHCDNSPDDSHFCSLHRPQCLGGYRSVQTKLMTLDICTDLVNSDDRSFACDDTNQKYVKHKDYKEIYPKWDIQTEKIPIAPYWKWFIVQYSKEITELFKYKAKDYDEDWKCIREEDAEADIRKRYQLK